MDASLRALCGSKKISQYQKLFLFLQAMRLQRLEIKGFKSFANETIINFGSDVIGIVGPNGSGKSNIVDAIRWVLGEQKSKELRLDTMSSVIFNGTKKRKAGGVAKVSLTFENTKNILPTEYSSVEITRLLYRSGESEYKLNGVTCRLKDITNLFMDTGIGSNSYAIIALGMVDEILADKDNSRRKMFEQAAGVSKYKARKKQTLNKLKSTTEDLDRIEDLLFEINNNLVSLEKQAKRARKYFELKDQYKDLSIQLAVLKIDHLKEQQRSVRTKVDAQSDTYRKLGIQIAKLEADLEAERKANIDKEKALSSSQRELNELIGQVRTSESDKRMLEQQLQFLSQNKQKISAEQSLINERIETLEDDIQSFKDKLNEAQEQEAVFGKAFDESQLALNEVKERHGSIKTELDQIVSKQQEAERAMFQLEKQKAVNINEVENYKRQSEQIRLDIDMREKERESLTQSLNKADLEEKKLKEEVLGIEKSEKERQENISKLEIDVDKANKELTKVNRLLDAKRNEFKLTKSMVENLEGFPESIKFLSSDKQWKANAPLLSDVIYVQDAYRIAIENYLEPYLNYYIVKNIDEAYEAIRLLSNSQKGKANFFLLDAFKDFIPPMVMTADAIQAIDLVETSPEYRQLFSYLLENVVVTNNSDPEKLTLDEHITVLSANGSFIRERYSISGGSVGLFEGKKIGRKKNLEMLEKAIAKLERDQNKMSTRFFQFKSKLESLKSQNLNPQLHRLRNELNKSTQVRSSIEGRLENFDRYISDADTKTKDAMAQIESLEAANKQIEEQLTLREKDLSGIKIQIANMDGSYREAAEELSAASAKYNEHHIARIQQQNRVESFKRELAFRENQLKESLEKIKQNASQLENDDSATVELNTKIVEKHEQLLEMYELRKVKEAGLTEAEQTYYAARGGINDIEDQLRKVNRQQQDVQVSINQLKSEDTDVKFKISSVAQRLKIEFDMDINALLKNRPEASSKLNKDELDIKVDRLKSRLENYGEINPMAVEAYDEMKSRYDDITKQKDDIIEAKNSLIETIKEIENTATEQFLEAFTKARTYFIDVFRSLFTEDDNCDLVLLEPDNPLESKIEIVAKPKGKRPQTISQLSGGEKTLTATALLFALYLLKPAPFCIFDEVDAPLDDTNIVKFNKIIKKFSKDSQFIIVTHNKLTMAAVDTIYGVYMAEQGVSGVSQVDFRDFDHKATFEVSNN